MKKKGYSVFSPMDNFFIFTSEGKNGVIQKGVAFQEVESNFYNLALVDFDDKNGTWSDTISSNNGDLSKVMATVVHLIKYFLENNSNSVVYLEGNSKAKQKLYNRIISNYYKEFSEEFEIFVEDESGRKPFSKELIGSAFYIHLKSEE